MIHEWQPNSEKRNLGDALTAFLADRMPISREEMESDDTRMYFLIGSVIEDETIINTIKNNMTPVFYNCGWRGREISPGLARLAEFHGCRGPRTKAALKRAGVKVDVTMDSAYLLDDYTSGKRKGSRELIIPHILSDIDSPIAITDNFSLQKGIHMISKAKFVLSGAMHGCILAHMAGVPWSPYAAEDWYIDCPEKWYDWFESIGLDPDCLRFNRTIEEGREWYNTYGIKAALPNENLS